MGATNRTDRSPLSSLPPQKAMGGYGAYLGWEIRKGNGGDATLTGGTAADLHPKLMGGTLTRCIRSGAAEPCTGAP